MKQIIYWISTVLISAFMLIIAITYLDHQPKMMAVFASLGYPSYFPKLLGVFKILGVMALLSPGFPILKEWAYAGFTFTFIGAFVSHLAVNQYQEALMPLIAMILLSISYFSRADKVPASMIANKAVRVKTNGPKSAPT